MAKTAEDLFNEYYTEIADQINNDYLSGEYPVKWEITNYTVNGVDHTELSNWLLDPVRETVVDSVSNGQISGVDVPCYITKGTFDNDEETLDIVNTDLDRILKLSKDDLASFEEGKELTLFVDYTIKIDTDVEGLEECKGKCNSKGKGKKINEVSKELADRVRDLRQQDYTKKAVEYITNGKTEEDREIAKGAKDKLDNNTKLYKKWLKSKEEKECGVVCEESVMGSLSKRFDSALLECDKKTCNKEIKDFLLGKSPKNKKTDIKEEEETEEVSFTEDDYNELVNELWLNTVGVTSIDVEEHGDDDYYISVWFDIDDDLKVTYDHDLLIKEIKGTLEYYADEISETGDGILSILLGVDPDISEEDKKSLIERLNKIRPIIDKYYKDEE